MEAGEARDEPADGERGRELEAQRFVVRRLLQLPRAERADLDAVEFVPLGGGAPMTWADSLVANYTDGIVVLHRGRIVYERYFGALTSDRPHIAFSVTKSFTGTPRLSGWS